MSDFATRLEEICAALETTDYQPPEDFSALTVQVGKRTALAMAQELRTFLRSGSSEVEAMAAVPFTLAFLVNVFVYCTESRSDAAVVDRIMGAAARIAHDLGDGAVEHLFPQRDSSLNCH